MDSQLDTDAFKGPEKLHNGIYVRQINTTSESLHIPLSHIPSELFDDPERFLLSKNIHSFCALSVCTPYGDIFMETRSGDRYVVGINTHVIDTNRLAKLIEATHPYDIDFAELGKAIQLFTSSDTDGKECLEEILNTLTVSLPQ